MIATSQNTKKLLLPEVTLCCVASVNVVMAERAIKKSVAGVEFGAVIVISSEEPEDLTLIHWIKVDPFSSVEEYSNYMLKELVAHIRTSHVLIIQWDGYVICPDAWDNNFMSYDYIGALWPHRPSDRSVGNGGFSLRSARLLAALRCSDIRFSHPEDLCVCDVNREVLVSRHGIRFAPPDVARRFSYERELYTHATFGFHGFFNFPFVLSGGELLALARAIPAQMTNNRDSRDLIINILRLRVSGLSDYIKAAKIIAFKRYAVCRNYTDYAYLKFRLAIYGIFACARGPR